MSRHDELIGYLARLAGIAETTVDAFGRLTPVPEETKTAILTAFGLPAASEAEAEESLGQVSSLREGLVPPLVVTEPGQPPSVPVRTEADETIWRLIDEADTLTEGRAPVDAAGGGRRIALPALTEGYHRLRVEAAGIVGEATVIVAPPRAFEPPAVGGGARLWGATAPVYGLRDAGDLGIGDFGHVGRLAETVGRVGGSFLGLSPLHALFTSDRAKISPYSPSSRLFLEPLFIDLTAVDGFAGSRAATQAEGAGVLAEVKRMREAVLVDYAAAWRLKRSLLDLLWQDFRGRGGDPAFDRYRRQAGEALQRHALFEALSERMAAEGHGWLGLWPAAYVDSRSGAVRDFAAAEADLVAFHAWLQWLADRQLAGAHRRAKVAGMEVGLYHDLAVGTDRAGSEVWSAPERYGATVSIGAPPDPLAPHGQDWGLPPINPLELERSGLASFRAVLRANMRHAGAIRIDHAFQLARLYLIPVGGSGSDGAYVNYPFEPLLAMLRLESHRARCMVICEDLGTSPPGFSDAIMRAGLASYRVLWFERDADGGFKPPEAYPRDALAVISTHDLPTFVGWWRGLDIDLRHALGLWDSETAERERGERGAARTRFEEALGRAGIAADPEHPGEPPFTAAVRYLGRTPSALAAVQMEDVLGESNPANLPGVVDGHPNWRRRLPAEIAAIGAADGSLTRVAAAFAAEARGMPERNLPEPEPPRATYRLQFHAGFTFDDATAILPYLDRLGVSHVYASPIHRARAGSSHGYDIVDHAEISPELGGMEGFLRFSDALRAQGMGLILDIVPNHMGIGGSDNGWWLSVLEWGRLSPFAGVFDIDWDRLGAGGKLVVPFLAERYGIALEDGSLPLAFDAGEGSFSVWHHEHRFPVSPLTYPTVLDRAVASLGEPGSPEAARMLAIAERLRAMGEALDTERASTFPEEAEALKRAIAELARSAPIAEAISRAVSHLNGMPGSPDSFGVLHRMLEQQSYRLAHWRVAASDINYRRFFDINGLAGIRVEDATVFEETHRTIIRLVRDGRVNGLRIDHIDGLADPGGYVAALQRAVGPGFYVLVEKILEPGEALRPWPVAGTTGYDVLSLIDGLFVDPAAAGPMEAIYRGAGGLDDGYAALLRQAKRENIETSFASELEALVSDLKRIADSDRRTRDFTAPALRRALIEIVARFPVYRTYIDAAGPTEEDRRLIDETIARAKRRSTLADLSPHDFIGDVMLGRIEVDAPGRPSPELARHFQRLFQQFTGPVMAKSLEDTLFYRYVRLIALNEVGGDPGRFGTTPAAFHSAIGDRAAHWPQAMIATATHDTKRGEDARARLLALSQMPSEWNTLVLAFEETVRRSVALLDGETAPDANDRLLILQALLGSWPLELIADELYPEGLAAFRGRMAAYVEKALREAKRHTSWVNPNPAYESAAAAFVTGVLEPGGPALPVLLPFLRRLAAIGAVNGLARTALKLTLPGVPDLYQGTETWDFSLVDPDNRRPVDFAARAEALAGAGHETLPAGDWRDGRIKQWVIAAILDDRRRSPEAYSSGDYRPLVATGPQSDRLIGFVRRAAGDGLAVMVPRLAADGPAIDGGLPRLQSAFAAATTLTLPAGRWRGILDGGRFTGGEPFPAGELFARLPIAVLRAE